MTSPVQRSPDDPALADVLTLIRRTFAYMDGQIDPPSSMHRLTLDSVQQQARDGEIWTLPDACMFLMPQDGRLYLGKLCVAPQVRGQGQARTLVNHAIRRARHHNLPCVTLQTRIELIENHARFRALGFTEVARTAHPGYDRDTAITFRRDVFACTNAQADPMSKDKEP